MDHVLFILRLTSTLLLLLSSLSPAVVFSHLASTSTPTWLPRHEVDWSKLFSGGISSIATPTFVARAQVDNDNGVAIGGVSGSAGGLYYQYHGGEIGFSSRFEMLVYPRGSLIWMEVVATPQNMSGCSSNRESWFPGGNQPGIITSSTLYICRGWYAGEMAIGQLLGNGTGGCEVISDNGRNSSTLERFEILISNKVLDSSSCSSSSVPPPVGKLDDDDDGHNNPSAIRWVPSAQIKNRSELNQGGVEFGRPFYIGRVTNSGGTLVGKATLYSSRNEFTYIFNGKEHSSISNFDFVVAPPGMLSWMQVVTPNNIISPSSCIPQNAFVGGDHSVEGIFYVCRVWRSSSGYSLHRLLVIGRLRRRGSGKCEIWMAEHQRAVEFNEFDVLVVNNEQSSCPTDSSPESPTTSSSSSSSNQDQEVSSTPWFLIAGMLVLLLLLLVIGIGGCLVFRLRFGGFQNSGGDERRRRERNISYAKAAADDDGIITGSS